MKKAQASFEYVMILGGVLLIVVFAFLLVQSVSSSGSEEALKNACLNALIQQEGYNPVLDSGDPGSFNCYVKDSTGNVVWKDPNVLDVNNPDLKFYTTNVPEECKVLNMPPARAVAAGSLPISGASTCEGPGGRQDNFGFIYDSSGAANPSNAIAWCCGPKPFN
ncbi:class III signal peptide-containing protein [Candidatus Micrarchaeota archaeon]|nr:class III signal peptide-containing protein [Candidatus Micrarchaeota archaeon]